MATWSEPRLRSGGDASGQLETAQPERFFATGLLALVREPVAFAAGKARRIAYRPVQAGSKHHFGDGMALARADEIWTTMASGRRDVDEKLHEADATVVKPRRHNQHVGPPDQE